MSRSQFRVSNILGLGSTAVAVAVLVGCAPSPYPDMTDTAVGGTVGTAVGAGTGALIGSSIKGGDVGDSALVGAGVGLASGLALGAAHQSAKDQDLIDRTDAQIKANRAFMIQSEGEITQMREHLRMEGTDIQVEEEEGHRLYVGPTVGTARPVN